MANVALQISGYQNRTLAIVLFIVAVVSWAWFVLSHERVSRWHNATPILSVVFLAVVIVVVVGCALWYRLHLRSYRAKEQSTAAKIHNGMQPPAREGYITARITKPDWLSDPQRPLEVGDSGTTFDLRYQGQPQGQPQFKFLYDAGLRIDMSKDGLQISTPIRDRSGRVIATIEKNHWNVAPPPQSWDWNYTENALEVLDGGGHVVMQVRLLPDRVQLQGEWHDEYGNGLQIIKCPDPNDNKKIGGCITLWRNPEKEQQVKRLIEPLFLYPSKDHLGELRKP